MMEMHKLLREMPRRIVACSGGIDSLLLATMAHRAAPDSTVVAHTVTPAVPGTGTARVMAFAKREGWNLQTVRSNEFDDERYLANPTNRCYYCKSNLYASIAELQKAELSSSDAVIMSGANTDDLGEYRPGLIAADEHAVRHPYVEAGWGKTRIRAEARELGLTEAELPASPCLASRIYTGTRVTAARVQSVEAGEAAVTELTGITVVRCRVKKDQVLVEVSKQDRSLVTAAVLATTFASMKAVEPALDRIDLDDRVYRPGQAILQVG